MAANDAREEIEYALTHIIPHKPFAQYIDDTVFLEVRELLTQHPDARVSAWKNKPRLYTLLRMLDYHHEGQVFARFEKELYGDFWLPLGPVALDQLATTTGFSASQFRRAQLHILSKSEQMSEEKLFSTVHIHRHIQYGSSHFEDKERIGVGGSAEVMRVKHKLSGREFACKRILRRPSIQAQRVQLIEFEQEVGVLQKISHLHFVRFIASFTDLRSFSLILEPVASDVLTLMLERQTRHQKLSDTDISTLRQSLGCLSTAVAYLHQQKVRHKDIKPGNILISGRRVLLCDFGVSLDWSNSEHSTTEGIPHRYTYRYSAPEVKDHDRRNSKSDIWSLGCVFLEIITVIKGYTIDEFHTFLVENNTGEGDTRLWYAPEVMSAWLEKIKSENHDSADDLPLSWIFPMIRIDPEKRIEASKMVDLIHKDASLNPDPFLFVAPCCSRSKSISDSGVNDTPTLTNSRFHQNSGLGISHAPASPPNFYNLSRLNHSSASIDERLKRPPSRTGKSMNSRDQSVSPRMQHVSLAKVSLDAVPIPMDQPNSPTNKALEHISSRSDSHHTSISFPVPPPAGYTVNCGCGSRPLEKHIFNAPFIDLAIDETLNINGITTIDAAIPTAELCTQCEIGENRVQIYVSPPEDPHIKNVQIPMIWWVTRRLVISYLSGTPKTRRCCSFWLPLADVQFIRSGPDVTLRWSDCNQMTQRSSGNYSQHYDWLYSPKKPNNGLLLRFNSDIDAQRYIDTLRLPYEDGATVSHSRTINASHSSEVQVFDVGKRGVRNYRVAVLTSNKDSLVTSKLFIQWPDLDLSVYVNTSPPEGHQMVVEFKNVSTPTYYSDVRGEPAVDHKKTGRFNKALKIKCGFAVTFPIAMGDGVPVPLPSVVDLFQALTGWTLRYLGVVECFKIKRKHFRSKRYGHANIMLWERGMSSSQRELQVTFRQQEETDFLWTSGTITPSSSVSFPGSGTDVTLSVSNKTHGKLLDVRQMAAIVGEEEKKKGHAHARSSSNAGEELSELVLTFELTHYRLAFLILIEDFKCAAIATAPSDNLQRISTSASART